VSYKYIMRDYFEKLYFKFFDPRLGAFQKNVCDINMLPIKFGQI